MEISKRFIFSLLFGRYPLLGRQSPETSKALADAYPKTVRWFAVVRYLTITALVLSVLALVTLLTLVAGLIDPAVFVVTLICSLLAWIGRGASLVRAGFTLVSIDQLRTEMAIRRAAKATKVASDESPPSI